MYALQSCCRWLSAMIINKLLIIALILTFIMHLPIQYRVVTQEVELEPLKKVLDLARMVSEKDLICLADNIFFEAGNQSDLGKKAVGYVTINRLLSNNFASDLCGIVYQRSAHACQFSWVCKHRSIRQRKVKEADMWQRSLSVAHEIVYSYSPHHDPTYGALFFHADYVSPPWSRRFFATTVINNHIFYRPNNGT